MDKPLRDQESNAFDTFQSPLKECCIYAHPELVKLLQRALNKAESTLRELARQQHSDKDKEALILAIQTCQEKKDHIVNVFAKHLAERFHELAPNNTQALAHKNTNKADISTQIILQKLNTDAVRHYQHDIDSVKNALKSHLNAEEILFFDNPFTPKQFIDCYYQSLTHLSVEPQALAPLLDNFQQEVLFQLNHFYKSLNAQLKSFTSISNSWSTKETGSSINDNQPFKLDVVKTEPANEPAVIHDLNQNFKNSTHGSDESSFLQGMGFPISAKAQASSIENDQFISRESLLNLLKTHQKAYDPGSDGTLINFVQQLIDDERNCKNSMQLRQQEQNTLNLTALIFDQIGLALSDRGKDLFNRLKAPYARLALDNDMFFTDQSNPARQLLDEIIKFNQQHSDEKIFIHQLKLSVSKIILRFKDEQIVFPEQLQHWQTLNKNGVVHEPHKIQKNTTPKKLPHDDRALQEMIEKQCHVLPRQLPFHIFTQQIWHNILSTIIKQRGTSSSHWQTAQLLLDKTLQVSGFFQAKTLTKQAEQLPILHEKIKKLFTVYKVSEMKQNIFFSQLESIEQQLMCGTKLTDIAEEKLPQADFLNALIQPATDTCN